MLITKCQQRSICQSLGLAQQLQSERRVPHMYPHLLGRGKFGSSEVQMPLGALSSIHHLHFLQLVIDQEECADDWLGIEIHVVCFLR